MKKGPIDTTTTIPVRRSSPMMSELKYALHLLSLNKLVVVGFGIAATLIVVAIVGPFFVPPSTPNVPHFDLGSMAQTGNPLISWAHPFGVDDLGRDTLDMVILSLGLDLGAAGLIVGIGLVIGISIGVVSGYFGGKIDEAIMRVTDVFLALPLFVWALAIAAVLTRSLNTLIIALASVSWPGYARIIRGQVLVEKGKPYVEGLQALGATKIRIMFRHIVPNSVFPLLVQASLDIGGVILTLAALAFLGLGLTPFTPELGNLVSRGSTYIQTDPALLTIPGIFIVLISMSFNLVGDGLRDVLDPRLRR